MCGIGDKLTYLYGAMQLFLDLSRQALLRRLARFDLASGEFP
jgi:hypothetical protein